MGHTHTWEEILVGAVETAVLDGLLPLRLLAGPPAAQRAAERLRIA